MTREELFLARTQFKTRVCTADGQTFQDLFVQVLQYDNPNFRPVKPQGKKGDKKNDGFDKEKGRYYQVYAPEDLKQNIPTALSKLKGSFKSFLEYWHSEVAPIKEYYFVTNDKYKGTYPDIEEALSDLERQFPRVKCAPFLTKDLEDVFMGLSEDKIFAVIGLIPDLSTVNNVDFSIMNEVVSHLMQVRDVWKQEIISPSPDFEKKIVFNKLSGEFAVLLRWGSYQIHVVEDYFKLNSSHTKADLKMVFTDIYEEAVGLIPECENKNDMVFSCILTKASPRREKAVQDAVLVLMAYYFEYCDIFESPQE